MGAIECRSPNEKISQGVAALLYRQAECDILWSRMILRRFRIFDDFLWAQALPFAKWNQCHLDMTSSAQTRKLHKTTPFAHGSHHLTRQQFPKGARHVSCSRLRKFLRGKVRHENHLPFSRYFSTCWHSSKNLGLLLLGNGNFGPYEVKCDARVLIAEYKE